MNEGQIKDFVKKVVKDNISELSADNIERGELDKERLPEGTLTLGDFSLEKRPYPIRDKDGNVSALEISTDKVRVSGITVGLGGGSIADNVALGSDALNSNKNGNANVALGSGSLMNNTNGTSNIGIGKWSLVSNTLGSNSIGIGSNALRHNREGCSNVAIGMCALQNNVNGNKNIAIGRYAGTETHKGKPNKSSNGCIYIGDDTAASSDGVDCEVVIGTGATGHGDSTTTISGMLVLTDIPTYSNDLPSGTLYIDDGNLKIVE